MTGGSERGWVWDGVPRRRRATLVDQALAAAARLKSKDGASTLATPIRKPADKKIFREAFFQIPPS